MNSYGDLIGFARKLGEFAECDSCRVNPGATSLCDACTHNRSVLRELTKKIAKARKRAAKWRARAEALRWLVESAPR